MAAEKADGQTAYNLIKRGVTADELIENNYTVADLASARVPPEEIARVAGQHKDTITLEVLSAVSGIDAGILKDNGYSALDLMKVGYTEEDLLDAEFRQSSVDQAVKTMDRIASDATAAAAPSQTAGGSNTTMLVVIVVAVVVILVVVVGAAFYVKKNAGGSGGGQAAAFENPMYDQDLGGGGGAMYSGGGQSGYMDVAPQQGRGGGSGSGGQSGYMDVNPAQSGGTSAAYMDVAPTAAANDGVGSDSDDEEV